MRLLFASILLLFAAIPSIANADISLDNWDVDDFTDSTSMQSWGINLQGLSSVGPTTLTNAGTGESLLFSSIQGTVGGGTISPNAVFESGGDRVGIDDSSTTADDDNDFDMGEGILFTFGSAINLVDINLDGMNDEERSFVFVNGIHTYSLLDGSDTGTYPGINILSPGSDDFAVNWAFNAGDTLEFRMNGNTGEENGYKVDTLTFRVVAVPEPSSLVLLGLISLATITRRRKLV